MDTLLPIMERDYKARIHALEQRCERLKEAGDKLCEAKNARILELEAALGWMIDGVQEWCDAVGRDSSWDGWDHHYKFFAYDDHHNGGLTAARKALKGSAPSDEGKP